MSVFKRKRTGKSGKTRASATWTVEFADHAGITRRLSAFTDRTASVELERHLKRLVALRMTGTRPDAELARFLESCPPVVRDHLVEWSIIESQWAAAGKPISAHMEDWRDSMTARGLTRKQVVDSLSRVTSIAKGCGWKHISDISTTSFDRWRNAQKTDDTLSSQTLNHYLASAKAFCNWLVKAKRLPENPLSTLVKLNAAADRRVERCASSIDELGQILSAACNGEETHGMTGAARALLYRLAIDTGFRWSELRSLTKASFDFNSVPATVAIRAEDAKNGLDDVLPLRPELAADLKAHMAMFLPAAKAFPGMGTRGAEMLRVDLDAAGIAHIDEYGRRRDFHALRHTFASLLNQANVPLATAQKLMRHSDPKLTANIYTHVMVGTKAEALAKLPQIMATPQEKAGVAKTGTDDAPPFEVAETVDRKMDSFGMDSEAKIKTYMDDRKGGFSVIKAFQETS